MVAVLGQWRSFTRILPKESQQRAICRCLEFQFHEANSLLFKEGDITDGWYIIYSGEVGLFASSAEAFAAVDKNPQDRRPAAENMLRSLFDRPFVPQRYIGNKEDFGSQDLIHDRLRTYAGVATQPSYIIRVDAHFYRMSIEWITQGEITQLQNYLQSIPELKPLSVHPESYERLAEKLERRFVAAGSDAGYICGGWMIIEKGRISRHRAVDFRDADVEPSKLIVGNVRIELPRGKMIIETDSFGENHLVGDASLSKSHRRPFSLKIEEDCTLLVVTFEGLQDLLPIDVRREVEKTLLDDPNDARLIKFWVEREREKQWEIYRARCKKDGRRYVRQVRREATGGFAIRRAKPPRAIKPAPSPRQYTKLSATLDPGSGPG
jgi:CRP-like cAMP-binding protein